MGNPSTAFGSVQRLVGGVVGETAIDRMLGVLSVGLDPDYVEPGMKCEPLPSGYMPRSEWLTRYFPHATYFPFAPHQELFWDAIEDLRPGVRPRPFVGVWARDGGKSTNVELGVVRVGAKLTRRFGLIVSGTQEQADKHVQDISGHFERLNVERAVNKFGHPKGWRRDQLRVANGFNLQGLGLDVAVRGIKFDEFRPDLICHEKGTLIHDTDVSNEWIRVEDHPVALPSRRQLGLEVSIWGCPLPETVTKEHRYWARALNKGVWNSPARWYTAAEIKNVREKRGWGIAIGSNISMREAPVPPIEVGHTILRRMSPSGRATKYAVPTFAVPSELEDPDWWWLIGLWWGDGTVCKGGGNQHAISIAIADSQPHIMNKVTAILAKWSYGWHTRHAPGCKHVIFSCKWFYEWGLKHWRHLQKCGKYLPGQKCPPVCVEELPLEFQSQLMRGYIDADGYVTMNECRITSVSLHGLICAKRILARLGIPAAIRSGPNANQYETVINGIKCNTQTKYDLRIRYGVERLGYTHIPPITRNSRPSKVWIDDGLLWSAVRSVTDSETEKEFVPITTKSHTYSTWFGISHNCLDDIDSLDDTLKATDKKIATITKSILPAGSVDCAVFAVQNLISEDSIFSRLCDGRADFLLDRNVSGPIPAVVGLKTETVRNADGMSVYKIVEGKPTWEGQGIAICENQMNTYGLHAFKVERQHEVAQADGFVFATSKMPVISPKDVPELQAVRMCWDLAATEDGGDYTVGVLMGRASNQTYYVLAVVRGQWSTERVNAAIDISSGYYRAIYSHLIIKVPQDPGQGGKSQAYLMRKEHSEHHLQTVLVGRRGKVERGRLFIDECNKGNVYLVEQDLPAILRDAQDKRIGRKPLVQNLMYGDWHMRLKDEFRKFREDNPSQQDDQFDASTDAYNDLVTRRKGRTA